MYSAPLARALQLPRLAPCSQFIQQRDAPSAWRIEDKATSSEGWRPGAMQLQCPRLLHYITPVTGCLKTGRHAGPPAVIRISFRLLRAKIPMYLNLL
ncbi:hypothetical protein NDU88_001852 [Pleurodeles waltl]|uniref:Uncharacterized protein n=1 Tax=Pleurodeles waltl TaxID=8319 RepID=A0AAV7UBK7_PLEWA|nr:hypothetical protein NDU88_001852 [Pleurodeles waltl]